MKLEKIRLSPVGTNARKPTNLIAASVRPLLLLPMPLAGAAAAVVPCKRASKVYTLKKSSCTKVQLS